jgi:hypothetical protein
LTNSRGRANPLVGLTEDEYRDFARALVSYVGLHATVDQTTYFMDLFRDYSGEIADKVAVGGRRRRPMVPAVAAPGRTGAPDAMLRSAFKKSRSH